MYNLLPHKPYNIMALLSVVTFPAARIILLEKTEDEQILLPFFHRGVIMTHLGESENNSIQDRKHWLLPCKAWAFWRWFQLESRLFWEFLRQTRFFPEQYGFLQRYKQPGNLSFWKSQTKHNKISDNIVSFLAEWDYISGQYIQVAM